VIENAARDVYRNVRFPAVDADARRSLGSDMRRLADLIIAPVARRLVHSKLLISADGALNYVPFVALPSLSGDGGHLLDEFEISMAPSMSALAAIRDRKRSVEPTRTLLVFADPVFTRDDARLTGFQDAGIMLAAADNALPVRSARRFERLPRLPYTAMEARAIEAVAPEHSSTFALGLDANRRILDAADVEDYRYLHFATHGLIDTEHPALSALALSRYDETGTAERFLLTLDDIYDLHLNADLVVLSACDTALGREIRGEGLVGLTQGFMHAGARSLVVSLWQVPDRATSELMSRFYEFLLNEGLRPAAALRQAQLSIASERRWADPYFWGAMVMIGDWS
jgi:CHAT domain-containing protein